MAIFALVFVPETKNVPQESIRLLFEGDIIKGAIADCRPKRQRAKVLRDVHLAGSDSDRDIDETAFAPNEIKGTTSHSERSV